VDATRLLVNLLLALWSASQAVNSLRIEFEAVDRAKSADLHINFEGRILSTSNVKSDSSPNVKWFLFTSYVKSDYSPHEMWRVTTLHNKCEEWLLPTSNVKSDSSPIQV
jgi:hypothetical protein